MSEGVFDGDFTRGEVAASAIMVRDTLVSLLDEASPSDEEAIHYLIDRYDTLIASCAN